MDGQSAGWTLGELAAQLGGELHGPPDLKILRPVSADADDPYGIAFAESADYLQKAEASGVGALILPRSLQSTKPTIYVDHPRLVFGALLAECDRPLPIAPGIHPTAVVAEGAEVDATASVGAYAVVERGARIGASARVYPFAYVGENCLVGAGSVLYPHAVLYKDVTVGARCIVHAGAVIGADGFGFLWDGQRRVKVPHAGGVELGDHVEIGANTTVDRSMTGVTRVGTGTKLDNLVQIGHNCTIGEHTVMASFVGISGSSRIGSRCVFGGQAALSDHVTVGDDITFGGRTGASQDVLEPGAYFGTPARPVGEAMRAFALAPRLPELFQRLRKLEKALERLEKENS